VERSTVLDNGQERMGIVILGNGKLEKLMVMAYISGLMVK
jgi:hypothetical protein